MNLVSVIVPTKNREDILSKTLDSVFKQEQVNIEVIVVNDGSSDSTPEMITENYPQVKLINNPQSVGGAKARNIGVEAATGDYIAFLDSDDEWLPFHLKEKLAIMKELSADGVYGAFWLNDDHNSKEIKFYKEFPFDFTIADKIASFHLHDARTSTFLFKKKEFEKIRFDENLKKHQDWDLAINFEKQFKFVCDYTPSVIIHVDSLHSRMSNKLQHNSTLYFLNKNRNSFKPRSIFVFCIKMIMRCQALNDTKSIKFYLQLISTIIDKLSVKELIIYYALKYEIINLNLLRKFKAFLIGNTISLKHKKELK